MTKLDVLNERQGTDPLRALDDLARLMATCRHSLADLAETVGRDHRVRAEELAYRVERHAPRIMIVGQVKAGKTALTNALAGLPDLLPMDVNPATSAVTSIHLNQPWRQPATSFVFFDRADWDSLTSEGGRLGALARRAGNGGEAQEIARQMAQLQARAKERLGARYEKLIGGRHNFDYVDSALLRRYVCLDDEEDPRSGRFAELTREAHVSIPSPAWPMAATLIDTPGVNDPFLLREQMTLSALAEADLCVIVLSAHQAMTTVDLALFRLLSGLRPDQALLFVNRVDELDDPEAQSVEIAGSLRRALRHAGMQTEPALVFGSAMAPTDHPLSGIAALRAEIAKRLAKGPAARPVLDALTEGQVIARQARALAAVETGRMERDEVARRLDPLGAEAFEALDMAVERGWRELRASLTRLVEQFTETECERMEDALRDGTKVTVWSVETANLRFMMGERYNAFAAYVTGEAQGILDRLAQDVEALYAELVGEGTIDVEAPGVPELPAPVTFAQVMTVDADLGWWRRLFGVGIKSRVERLREALRLEALGLVTELGATQVPEFAREVEHVARDFFESHSTALLGVATSVEQRDWSARPDLPPARLTRLEDRIGALADRFGREGRRR